MARDERSRRSGRGKGVLVGLACLLAGLAIGRLATGPKIPAGGRSAATRAEIPARFRTVLCRIARYAAGGPRAQ